MHYVRLYYRIQFNHTAVCMLVWWLDLMFLVFCCCSNTGWKDSTGLDQRETSHRCGATVTTTHSMTTTLPFFDLDILVLFWYYDILMFLKNTMYNIILFSHMSWHIPRWPCSDHTTHFDSAWTNCVVQKDLWTQYNCYACRKVFEHNTACHV